MTEIIFSDELIKSEIKISIAIVKITDFTIISKKYDFAPKIYEIVSELRNKYSIKSLKDDPIIAGYRKFYWNQLHIDPTKIRPSSEALIRRILKNAKNSNEPNFPKISPFVDAYNWASAATLIPMGAYDINSFEPPVIFRLTGNNEEFVPIGNENEKKILKPNTLVIADKNRNILSQFPYRDSKFSMIRKNSKNIILIACGVPGISKEQLFRALSGTKNNLEYLRNMKVIKFRLNKFEYFSLLE
ncbi:MAG: B3/B4 domain-containing protein [Promethearchaeota archaeon]